MQIIFETSTYSLRLYKSLPENVRLFLNTIAWGNKGTIYERPVSQKTATQFHNPHVFVVENDKIILATVVANAYSFPIANEVVTGYYFRYFASNPVYRGNPLVAKNSLRVLDWLQKNTAQKDFFYAYLEKKNEQSSKLVKQLGYQKIGESATIGFSRFFPKKSKRVHQAISKQQKDQINQLLSLFYKNHALVHTQAIHLNDAYYYVEDNGKIVAGIQVLEGNWKIKQMEGLSGKLILAFAGYIPFVNRLFSPNPFKFLGVEGIFYEKGQEKALFELIEHVLAQRNYNAALIWQDPSCPYYIGNSTSLGLLNKFVSGTGSAILAKGTETGMEELRQKPKYISCFDFI